MTSQVKGIPDGASVVIPRLFCRNPAAQIEFCQTTFGAEEGVRRCGPDGSVMHALVTIGPAMVMIEREGPASRAARHCRMAARRWCSTSMSRTSTRRWTARLRREERSSCLFKTSSGETELHG